jgi:hypothetical protein
MPARFFLAVRVLSRLFLDKLAAAHQACLLHFFCDHAHLDGARAFAAHLAPLRNSDVALLLDGHLPPLQPIAAPRAFARHLMPNFPDCGLMRSTGRGLLDPRQNSNCLTFSMIEPLFLLAVVFKWLINPSVSMRGQHKKVRVASHLP